MISYSQAINFPAAMLARNPILCVSIYPRLITVLSEILLGSLAQTLGHGIKKHYGAKQRQQNDSDDFCG